MTLLIFRYLLVTYLAERRWTISIFLLPWSVYGFHTEAQYSMFGRTRVKYAEALVSLLLTLRFLCRKPIILLPFFTILSMCLFQERLEEISTPRYLDCVSASRVWFLVVKVSKGAKIRNRYNQVPHLTQDTNGKVTNSQQTPQTRAKRSALSQQVITKHI